MVKKESEEALNAGPTAMSELTADIYVEKITGVRACDPFTRYD
jgi:hypothetical protein